ncbi:hypothetical protein [Actinacidiphila sp. ITFR-21]|uniref:phage tail tube protein n=1 Tax=Actinacidiphila sp. ITFR-21 TaxID=3075199 RepID=UPI00288B6D55|nr:hypothetical protein [Streptomyces sp. ITFR-21]WNI16614.1 hypothetical protein RLT57_14580 [Streptomyces sp. ITFR-21]
MRYGTTGRIAVLLAPSVADLEAPTVAECTAAKNLTPWMLRDGLKTPATGNTIDSSDAANRFTTTAPGTYGGDAGSFQGHRDSLLADDDAWTALAQDVTGVLIVFRSGCHQNATTGLGTPDGAATAADRCETYPFAVISRAMDDIAENQTSRFTASLAFIAPPVQDAAVVAGA